MKTIKLVYVALVTLLFLTNTDELIAQKQARLLKSESFINISGTSNLHDWDEKLTQFDCSLLYSANENEPLKLEQSELKSQVKNIESGNSIMNSKTFKALKSDEHPELRFILKSTSGMVVKDGKIAGNIIGEATIAGTTKTLTIPINGTYSASQMKISGTQTIHLLDFGISPPTALMGTLKTGKDVIVNFSLTFLL